MQSKYFHYALGEKLTLILNKKAAYFLGKILAKLHFRLISEDRRALVANLGHALAPRADKKEVRRAAEELIVNFSRYLVDLMYSFDLTNDRLKRCATLEGAEHLEEALSRKKGTILASAHLGNWEVGGMALARLGYSVHGLALKHKDPRIESVFRKRRSLHGLSIISMDGTTAIRQCYRVLKANKILGLMADRIYGDDGIPVTFFGREVKFPQGIARLRKATGAAVLPAFILMTGPERYKMRVHPPLTEEDPKALVQHFASVLEHEIRRNPSQWFIFQPFWETPRWPA